MDKFYKHKFFKIIYIIILALLVFLAFWKSLYLGFYRDDWSIWTSQNYFLKILIGHSHPGTWIEDYLLFKIFGFNTYLWQGLGIFLRIIASYCVYLMAKAITKSMKIAFLSGLLFAPNIYAMETVHWLSVYIVPQIIALSCLVIYFWIRYIETKFFFNAFIAIFLLIVSIIGDPGRAILIIPMVLFWESINWWISYPKESIKKVLARMIIFVTVTLVITKTIMQLFSPSPVSFLDYFKLISRNIMLISNLFVSLSNLLTGWFNSLHSIGNYRYTAIILLFFFLRGLYLTIFNRSRNGASILFFTSWIIILYIPNWMINPSYSVSATDRYLGMSSVGYIILLAILFTYRPIKYLGIVLILLFIFSNVLLANKVIDSELNYRARSFTEPLWDQIYEDVPSGEKNSLFIYLGNDYAKYTILDWSGPIPYGIRANITKYEELPITTADRKLIRRLLCEDGVLRPSIFDWVVQPKRIQLSHLHAWELNNNRLTNVSVRERELFRQDAQKINCTLGEEK